MLAGGGLAAAGAGVTSVALDSMTDCSRESGLSCPRRYSSTPPVVAMPVAAAGLGIAFLGAVVLSQGTPRRPRAATKADAVPSPPPVATAHPPPVLDQTSAVGMAVARLSMNGITLRQKPARLLLVDDTQASVHVDGERAALWNLRVLTTADWQWHPAHACYELKGQWELVKISTAPGCSR